MNFGLNGECKNLIYHETVCSTIGVIAGNGSLLNNTPNHYQVSVPFAIVYFQVKICVASQIHVKKLSSF